MMLEEINRRLKKQQLTEEQLKQITPLYILLDFDKDTFAKIVEAVGVEKIADRQNYFDWLLTARDERKEKEQYWKAMDRLEEVRTEKEQLEKFIENYRKHQ